MKALLAVIVMASSATPASALDSVIVRTDQIGLATERNVMNSLDKLQKRAAATGRIWTSLLACDRRYFLVTGRHGASEANAEAMAHATEFSASQTVCRTRMDWPLRPDCRTQVGAARAEKPTPKS